MIVSLQIGWALLTVLNLGLVFYLIRRKRQLAQDYMDRHDALQAEVNSIQARNNVLLQNEKEKIDRMKEYWREELRKIGIPDPDTGEMEE